MAMCASGNLSIKSTAGTCRDICAAVVLGGGSPSGSLSALSVAAGKTAPHSMLEFYGYDPIIKTAIDWTQYATNGTPGSSSCVCRYFCIHTKPAVGQTYSLCVTGDLSNSNQQSGSYALICVTCNGASKMYCCIPYTEICAAPGVLFTVDSNDCVRSCNRAYASNTSCSLCARSGSCIASVTGTYHCKGTTCPMGFTYTG